MSRKVVTLLRHNLPNSGLPYANDGSIRMKDLIELWKSQGFFTTEEKIIACSDPYYGGGKSRFVVSQEAQGLQGGKFLVATGGHSFPLSMPFGSIPVRSDCARLIDPAFHQTDAKDEIEQAGFISQMRREGGINCSYGSNHSYARRGNGYWILVAKSISFGIRFCHNQYSDIVFCMGEGTAKWIFRWKTTVEDR